MRITKYDPTHDTCSNCMGWSRYALSQDGKALGYCRAKPPTVFAFRHIIPEPGGVRVGVQEAQVTAFPTTAADMTCMEHMRKVDA